MEKRRRVSYDDYETHDNRSGPYFVYEAADGDEDDPEEDGRGTPLHWPQSASLRKNGEQVSYILDSVIEPRLLGPANDQRPLTVAAETDGEDLESELEDSEEDEDSELEDTIVVDTNLPNYPNLTAGATRDVGSGSRGLGPGPGIGKGLGRTTKSSRQKNPLHVREMPPEKGSRQRGNVRGVKKGPRKPIEPGKDFKELESQALSYYVEQDYERAEELTQNAIQLNPEMFSAWALLSRIYEAQGDEQRAITTLFHAAHTRPSDAKTWANVAEDILYLAKDREKTLPDAIYCYNRVISVDKDNIEARQRRAELHFECGNYKRAIFDYQQLLKIVPHDLEVLQLLSQAYTIQGTPLQGIVYYDEAISYYRDLNLTQAGPFSWSDLNVYADLHLIGAKYEDGLRTTKELARWIQGRSLEVFWNLCEDDDSEYDAQTSQRRLDYLQSQHAATTSFAEDLPLEIRVKLGLFRLHLGNRTEAMSHFHWLLQAQEADPRLLAEYFDVSCDIANALMSTQHFREALDFYFLVQGVEEAVDNDFLMNVANCHRQLKNYPAAERCYRSIMESDELNIPATEELVQVLNEVGAVDEARVMRTELNARRRKNRELELGHSKPVMAPDPDAPLDSIEVLEEDSEFETGMITRTTVKKQKPQPPGPRTDQRQILKEDLRPTFRALKQLEHKSTSGNSSAQLEWIMMAATAIEHFKAYKGFWPWDKHLRFYGYTKDARRKAQRPIRELADEDAESANAEEIPTEYCCVSFEEWLDCHLQYALQVSQLDDSKTAYEVCKLTADCSVWHHDQKAQFTIHLVWSMCAVSANDQETMVQVSRFFMKQQQFTTNAYRLFGIFNRFCNRRNSSFSKGPTQKYAMRQVKAMDTAVGKQKVPGAAGEPSSAMPSTTSSKSSLKETDVGLLMMYGYMLYAATSYKNSIHYFYRAHALEPENPMILLALALAYVHHSTKRQSENRQRLISHGMTFLFRYYDLRKASANPLVRQEAEYNVGRTFHLLGLLHLAIPYYERCLGLSQEVQELMNEDEKDQDFAPEVAYSLRGFYMQSGATQAARRLTERWLQI